MPVVRGTTHQARAADLADLAVRTLGDTRVLRDICIVTRRGGGLSPPALALLAEIRTGL